MRNQIEAAERLGLRAVSIDSTNEDGWPQIEEDLIANQIDLLMISPERLANEAFRQRVLQVIAHRIALFVVDEAHCISDWGHDFRPDYRRIVRVLRALPSNIAVLATTATANDRVVEDVRSQLGDTIQVIRGPLVRQSLHLQNMDLPNPVDRYVAVVQLLRMIEGSGIIYTLTVRDAIRLTDWLQSQDIDAQAYYSDLDNQDKSLRPDLERRLLNNQVKALVSTVALGMGFDKPDLAFVIHFQRPASVVLYYQQVGRAGRAVENAFGILMGGAEDDDIANYFMRAAFPPQAHVKEVLDALREAEDGQSTYELEKALNLSHSQIEKTLKFLSVEEPSPVAKSGSKWSATAHALAYHVDEERLAGITTLRRQEQEQMQSYMLHDGCLMHFLSEALDDPEAADCGRCAGCLGEPIYKLEIDQELQIQAAEFLRRTYQPIRPRKQKPAGRFEVFASLGAGKTNLPVNRRCEEGRALSIWGDPGWGVMVRRGKYPAHGTARFDDRLVEGCVEMLAQWQPQPSPTWVTAIPSLQHPDLVPDFARRLATRLNLPYCDALIKTRHCQRQRDMQNSAHQVANLDGSLCVSTEGLPLGPVLLVDDMTDSGWTFTVAGHLLRENGVAAVFPLALALNSISES
jgi:ATP-dependent DNA helicase RecQ